MPKTKKKAAKTAAKKSTKKKVATKKVASKKAASKKTVGRTVTKKAKAGGGLAALVTPSEALAKIVGKRPISRAQITKKLWDHIKANGLQDPDDGRIIHADEALQPIFGRKKKIVMTELAGLVSPHVS